ncbi:MAG: hypothetical protein K6A44_07945 [bacterium]|nr:hypothetical protein [bacterium]
MFEKKINKDYLRLAKIAYGGKFYYELGNYKLKEIDISNTKFKKIPDTLLSKNGDTDFYSYKNEDSGFVGNVFENRNQNEIVIAFRGTERFGLGENVSDILALIKDVLTDLNLMVGIIDEQFSDAWNFYKTVKKQNPKSKIIIVGQSLGGALTQLVSAKEYTVNRKKVEAYSFNAPGCKHLLEDFDCNPNLDYSFITNYSVMNDWCGVYGERVGSCYLITPIPMEEVDNNSTVQVLNNILLTTHEGIFEYTEDKMGKVIRKPKSFNQTEGLSLWYFDKNNPMKYFKSMPDFINSITQKFNLPAIDFSGNFLQEQLQKLFGGETIDIPQTSPVGVIIKNAATPLLSMQTEQKEKLLSVANGNIISVVSKQLEFIFSQISAESIKTALKVLMTKTSGKKTHKDYIDGIIEYLSNT